MVFKYDARELGRSLILKERKKKKDLLIVFWNDALLRVEASVKTLYTNCPYKSSKQNIMIVHPNHHTMFVQNASARAMSRYVVRELRLIGQNEKKFRFRQKTGPWTGGTDGTRVRSRTAVVRSRAPSIVSDWQFTESVEKTLLIVMQNSCFQVNNSAVTKKHSVDLFFSFSGPLKMGIYLILERHIWFSLLNDCALRIKSTFPVQK